jgi:hypothetical protein
MGPSFNSFSYQSHYVEVEEKNQATSSGYKQAKQVLKNLCLKPDLMALI